MNTNDKRKEEKGGFFLTAIWLPYGQLWVTFNGTTSGWSCSRIHWWGRGDMVDCVLWEGLSTLADALADS